MAPSPQEARHGGHRACTRIGVLIVWSLALLAVLGGYVTTVTAEGRSPNGSGIFSLSLAEALDIRVDASPLRDLSEDGIYLIDRHELIQLRSQPQAWQSFFSLGRETLSDVPLLVDGEYFGNFSQPRDVAALTRDLRSRLVRIELFVGDRARWWSKGEYDFVINVITKATPERSDDPGTIKEERRS